MSSIRASLYAALCGLTILACGSDDGKPSTTPSTQPPPSQTADNIAVHFSLKWHQDPRSEVVQCHYFKTTNAAAEEVSRINLTFPEGSHHVHIYRSDTPEPDGVKDCTAGIDWNRWSMILGAQTKPIDWSLPDGVTIPIPAQQQILVQVHWLNTTDQPIDREINVDMTRATHTEQHLGVAFGVSKDVLMAPHASHPVGSWVPVPEGSKLVAIMGHFHARGKHYKVDIRRSGDADGELKYSADDEQTFEFKHYDYANPPVFQSGQGLAYECDFENTTDGTLTWGPDTVTQEHCNLAAYYYPAKEKLSNTYIVGDLKAITATPTDLVAGQQAQGQVELATPAGQLGVDVALNVDQKLLHAPAIVHVPAWQSTATFTVDALSPASTTLHASTGSKVTDMPWNVRGLSLSEVYYKADATNPDGKQWIEIANTSSVPIDLSRYSLGAGVMNYAATRVSLGDRILPAGGCLVVGGPTALPGDDMSKGVLTIAEPFRPALTLVDDPAGGVALFGVPLATDLDADALPLDALVYGKNNAHLMAADGQMAVPVPGPAIGSSLERSSVWAAQAAPSPGVCKVAK